MAGQDKKGSSNAPVATKDKLDLNLCCHPIFLHQLATTTSENPINGKTLHEGHIARVVVSSNRMFMAKQQKNSHTLSKETSNDPPQCPRHQIRA